MANMEDLLDLYAEPYDPRRPVVCFDETSTQLLADTRTSLPSRPGIPLQVEQRYLVPGLQGSALPRFHRRDSPARVPSRCTSPTWRGWTTGPAAWSRSP